jgi:hypothetical protein
MANSPDRSHPSSPERNPLGLGPRDRESSNTGSTADTSYDAHGSDPYLTGEPRKTFDTVTDEGASANPDPADADDA